MYPLFDFLLSLIGIGTYIFIVIGTLNLLSTIHIFVILLIVTACHVVHPFLVVEIPFHGFFDALLELETWLPSEFLLQLARVYGITHIVALAVSHVSDEIEVFALFATQQAVNGLDYHLDDIDVLPLVETADVISFGNLSLMENHIDSTCMVLHIQPVAHILALTIYWQWLAMTDIVDEQRNQLLRELIWSVVVGAVGHDGWHSVCVVESTDEMV